MDDRINSAINFLVYSNIYLAVGASCIAYITMVLLGLNFEFMPLFFTFSETFFVYNLNRQTKIRRKYGCKR